MVNSMADAAGLRVYEGRMIFEVRPPVSMNKGSAFRTLVDEFKLGAAIYIGDDTTDIDAIVAARELREAGICHGVGVGVASPETPQAVLEAADLSVDGVSGVESFFEWLLSVSSASSS
jgi:trehalose 6-phosphate phosphatase